MTTLDKKTIEELSPGVRDLVVMLNNHGFVTCDSGDGSNFKEGMDCASPEPMIAMKVKDQSVLVSEANRLYYMLQSKGVKFPEKFDEKAPGIQASYNPADGHAIIILVNVLSIDVGLLPLFEKANG